MLRLRALTYVEQWSRDRAVQELEDKYLDMAYDAEASGNYNLYNYYLGWARRAGEVFSPENITMYNARHSGEREQ